MGVVVWSRPMAALVEKHASTRSGFDAFAPLALLPHGSMGSESLIFSHWAGIPVSWDLAAKINDSDPIDPAVQVGNIRWMSFRLASSPSCSFVKAIQMQKFIAGSTLQSS